MKPNATNLERLIKKIGKGEAVAAEDVLFHWRGLEEGNRIVISFLGRHQLWQAFVTWAAQHPDLRVQLQAIANLAGVTHEGVVALQQADIDVNKGDTPRTRANTIIKNIEQPGEWQRSFDMLRTDLDFLHGTLFLLEQKAPTRSAEFLSGLLKMELSRQQDQLVRKSLYRLRQKGIEAEQHAEAMFTEKEYFAFGQNRLPLWQPVIFFRAHSAFTATGDLHILQLTEGALFDQSEQHPNMQMDRKGMLAMCQNYSNHLHNQTGLEIPFSIIPENHARYFLQKSFSLLPEEAKVKMSGFLKFLGEVHTQDPFQYREVEKLSGEDTAALFRDRYFVHWIIRPEDLENFFQHLRNIQEGPIVLPESQLRLQRQKVIREALHRYFNQRNRAIWSLAFEKAAYFLDGTDRNTAMQALTISRNFLDAGIPVEDLPAALVLFEKTMDFVAEAERKKQEEEKKSSLIVAPSEFQRK